MVFSRTEETIQFNHLLNDKILNFYKTILYHSLIQTFDDLGIYM